MGRVGKSRRRRKARQSAMEPLINSTSNEALPITEENMGRVTCTSSTQASEHSLLTSTFSSICHLKKLPGSSLDENARSSEREETSRVVDFEAELVEKINISNLTSRTDCGFEQQLVRFEEYVRPVLELFNLPPLPTSEVKSVWTEVAPYQVCDSGY